ncbi:LANO_0F05710g1_1 [Lachancea nothofagi CBS 11611]|uniref:MICOS complex subunit MIC60 n=1 Tax=Lachancea nothofagi CBS 11611 TaxID=1266666 RepID=A0A1G4K854_9SACH|nr:LANO_0F05710g1_1 [Lachancea nothofagi CBS 11611]
MLRSRNGATCARLARTARCGHFSRKMATFQGEPLKRSHPLRNFVIRATLAITGFYAGGVALSVYSDQFGELFCDNVPLAEELVELYESYRDDSFQASRMSLEDLKQKFGELGTKTDQIPARGADSVLTTEKFAARPATPEIKVEQEACVKLRLPTVDICSNSDPRSEPLLQAVNAAVDEINSMSLFLPEDTYSAVSDAYNKLNTALQELDRNFQTDLSESLARQYGEASEDLRRSYELRQKARELELTEQFLNEFNAFKSQLEKRSSEELSTSLKANEQALLAKQANEVALLSIKQVEEFNKILAEKLDQERQGRLSKLEELDGSVKGLTEAIDQVDTLVIKSEVVSQLTLLTTLLKSKLRSGSNSSVQIDSELARLKTLCEILPGGPSKCCKTKNPQLLDIVVSQLESLASKQQILSNEQLYSRWTLLQKDLTTSSLLPPNAGILGHTAAKIFSLFLFDKSGAPVENDIDSVIARVGTNLTLSKLDKAVEEVVALKGWPRVLCDEWVQEARMKLEIETLIDALDCEVRSL